MNHPNRTDVVAQAKADLEAAGIDLHSPCGAWRITNLAAWRMKAEGAGLLDKPNGNNCAGYSTDIIAFPDGAIFDVLISSETENGPAWQDVPPVDPSRWRAPVFPDYLIVPPPPPPPVDGDLAARVAALEGQAAQMQQAVARVGQWLAQAPR